MRRFIQYRFWFLGGMLLLSAIFAWTLKDLKIDFSFDRFLPQDDPEYQFYQSYRDSFPHDDNAIQIALKRPKGTFWEAQFLAQVDHLFEGFRDLPYTDTVLSPTRLLSFRRAGMSASSEPLIDFSSAEAVEKSKSRLANDSLLYANFFSADRVYLAGVVLVSPEFLDKKERDSVSISIQRRLEASGMDYVVSGVPYIRTQYVQTIRTEMLWFIGASVVMTLVIMFVLYRTWWGMLLPQLGVILSLVWTLGFMGMTGKPLDMVAELLPSIMFVVGIADIIHLFTRYQQELSRGLPRKEAMRLTISEIGIAIFLTSLTTAIGFASLFVSPLTPVKEFGLYAAAGVIFAYIIAMAIIPTALMAIPAKNVLKSRGLGYHPFWERMLAWIYLWVRRQTRWIVAASVLLVGVSFWGMSLISFNTYLLDDISHKDPAYQSLRFFEEEFYGARPFEMAIIPKNGKQLTDPEILQDIDQIQEYLNSKVRISPFLSIVSYLKNANKLYKGGNPRHYRLPTSESRIEELIAFGYSGQGKDLLDLVMNRKRTMGRVSATMPDVGSDKFYEVRDSLEQFIARKTNTENFDYHLTGSAILTDQNVEFLREGLFTGLALAFGLIALLMGALFRSWRMLLIGVIPNMIPLLFTAGLMGFFGITLRASTSIVFLVAFGIAVDDTIHFLSRLRIEQREGRDLEAAIRNATVGTGKALVMTTLILLAGFVFLLTSDFGGTFVTGFFTAVTLLVALLSDLLLLPILVRWSGLGKKFATPPPTRLEELQQKRKEAQEAEAST